MSALPPANVIIAWVRRLIGRVIAKTTIAMAKARGRPDADGHQADEQPQAILVEAPTSCQAMRRGVVRGGEGCDFGVERRAVVSVGVIVAHRRAS
jgi:hypothetical protein